MKRKGCEHQRITAIQYKSKSLKMTVKDQTSVIRKMYTFRPRLDYISSGNYTINLNQSINIYLSISLSLSRTHTRTHTETETHTPGIEWIKTRKDTSVTLRVLVNHTKSPYRKHTHTHTHTHTERERERERERDGRIDKQTDRQKHTHTHRESNGKTGKDTSVTLRVLVYHTKRPNRKPPHKKGVTKNHSITASEPPPYNGQQPHLSEEGEGGGGGLRCVSRIYCFFKIFAASIIIEP